MAPAVVVTSVKRTKSLSNGWKNQLTRQIGEHLITAELGKRDYAATPFAGNIPDWDLLAANEAGVVVPIQVKAIRDGSWQFDIRKFLNVTCGETEQVVHGLARLKHPNLVCIFVNVKPNAPDQYYLFSMSELQERAASWFHPRRVPNKIASFHWAFRPRDIEEFRDRWQILDDAFDRGRVIETPIEP